MNKANNVLEDLDVIEIEIKHSPDINYIPTVAPIDQIFLNQSACDFYSSFETTLPKLYSP